MLGVVDGQACWVAGLRRLKLLVSEGTRFEILAEPVQANQTSLSNLRDLGSDNLEAESGVSAVVLAKLDVTPVTR